jgi:uncharacterized damage-inducible protein DinB
MGRRFARTTRTACAVSHTLRGVSLGQMLCSIFVDDEWGEQWQNGHSCALTGADVPDLRQSYGENLALLRVQRERLDAVITALAGEVGESDLEQVLVYRNTRGMAFSKPFGSLLLHMFNHQTHHRGQASTLLTQAGVDIGVTDLLMLIEDRPPA